MAGAVTGQGGGKIILQEIICDSRQLLCLSWEPGENAFCFYIGKDLISTVVTS